MSFIDSAFFNDPNLDEFLSLLDLENHDKIMHLSIFVDNDNNLKNIYLEAAKKHNTKLLEDPHFFDAGFDLYLPRTEDSGTRFYKPSPQKTINKVDFKIKCCATIHPFNNSNIIHTGFYLYPRSSLSKTPLRLANSTGIIDAGYRGPIIGMFDVIYSDPNIENINCDWYENEYSRLLQICGPSLCPIFVRIVDTIEELGPSTNRGSNGFGSTGK